ncbi:IclR family transcriptional regulator [Aminivibrio sp.]|uniref:IclR family transcriptional regulator n=1 Tax=Aminivibrio sp. TaxID=1872489 RepID=UPI003D960236
MLSIIKKASSILSVEKAFIILDLLGINNKPMSLGEISKELKFPKSTAYGLLATMCKMKFVEQLSSGDYALGVRLFELGSIILNNWDFRAVAGPHIDKLLKDLQETIQLAVLSDGEVLYIDKRECHQSLRVVSEIGTRLPAHCTSLGKVLLSSLSRNQVERILNEKGLRRYTKNTITKPDLLEKELNKVRFQGYAIDDEEFMEGLYCVAAPIADLRGLIVAAISISGPVGRLSGKKIEDAILLVKETADKISASIR